MRSKFGTDELFNQYFATMSESRALKTRGQIDREEVYEYEEKLNKPLYEFDAMEIIDMMKTFNNKTYIKNFGMSLRSYDYIASNLRNFFNWYIDNVKVIKNPMTDKRIRGFAMSKLIKDDKDEIFTKETLDKLIENIHDSNLEQYAIYMECVLRMFYEGFPTSKDIVLLKKEDIDFENHTAQVQGRTIKLSDELFNAMVYVNESETFPANHGDYVMVSYDNSFFKFPTREKYTNIERDSLYWARYLSRFISRIKNEQNVNISGRMIYLLGFHDYIVSKIGKERTDELINATRNPAATKELMQYADEYGIRGENVTSIKKSLMQFVE